MSDSGFEADLARHAGWIRALALELVRDPNVAEDLAQDAMLVALRRPPVTWPRISTTRTLTPAGSKLPARGGSAKSPAL